MCYIFLYLEVYLFTNYQILCHFFLKEFDWPIEGLLVPNSPSLKKPICKTPEPYVPVRLRILRNGDKNKNRALTVISPDISPGGNMQWEQLVHISHLIYFLISLDFCLLHYRCFPEEILCLLLLFFKRFLCCYLDMKIDTKIHLVSMSGT